MALADKRSVLELFRMRRNEEAFQFLTWYMILVKQVNLDDIIEFVMKPTEYINSDRLVFTCYFTTKTKLEIVVTIERLSQSPMHQWHCTSSEQHLSNEFRDQ